ncbi:MAG: SDR family oxidoreductase [Pirellulaceae bacterium]
MSLADKTAVVVGGGTGIGLGIARCLAATGCRVAIAGRREAVLQQSAASWQGPVPMICYTVDVARRDSVIALADWAERELGHIDILVCSAGINIRTRSMAEMQPDQWDDVMAVNATGTYNCFYAFVPNMRKRGDGLIVNISSVAGKRASMLAGIAYSAAKFAATGLGMAVGREEGERGIRVTNIYPGEVETPILDQRPVPVSQEHRQRILQPEDIGQLVVAIASLPPRAHVPELVIKPVWQEYV